MPVSAGIALSGKRVSHLRFRIGARFRRLIVSSLVLTSPYHGQRRLVYLKSLQKYATELQDEASR